MTRRRVVSIFVGFLLAVQTALLSRTVVSKVLPTVVGEVGGLSWATIVYSMVSTPLWEELGDLYECKPVFRVAIGVSAAGSALSGLSRGMAHLPGRLANGRLCGGSEPVFVGSGGAARGGGR